MKGDSSSLAAVKSFALNNCYLLLTQTESSEHDSQDAEKILSNTQIRSLQSF
jgi:hypothetical protein